VNDGIRNNILRIQEKISESALKAGRKPDDIKLMAVSKRFSVDSIVSAYNNGIRLFGENRAGEAVEKFSDLKIDFELHFIGHLQSNKCKMISKIADCVQSIDKFKTASLLNDFCEKEGRTIDILFEMNTSGEDSKNGFKSEEIFFRTLDQVRELKNIKIRGLMTIGPMTADEKAIRNSFARLRNLYEKLESEHRDLSLDTLSMGMSSDYEIAIDEGSTLIRLGTAIFGDRKY